MDVKFDFFRTTMPETREADYYLGCLNSSVFMDFKKTADNIIYLARISFDGFGCYELFGKVYALNEQDSKKFIEEIETENLNQEVITGFVKELISLNKEQIWTDALEKYNLID